MEGLLRLLCWWHLLSFDAPTVAVVWACLFARIMHLRLPWFATLILGLGTWLIYIADRLLDGVSHDELKLLRERHRFYARNSRHFIMAAFAVCAMLLWLIATHMSFLARRDDAIVFGIAMVYFGAIHGSLLRMRSGTNPLRQTESTLLYKTTTAKVWLPKEVVVAILFAAATAVPAWSRLDSNTVEPYAELFLAAICFATLCWPNCVAIEHWETMEGFEPTFKHMRATTQWAGRNLSRIALAVCGVALYLSAVSLRSVFLSSALSAAALFALDRFSRKLSSIQLRVAADAALLTPLLFLIR